MRDIPIPDQLIELKQQVREEHGNIQFEYWIDHAFTPWYRAKADALKEATDAFGLIPSLPLTVPEWEMAAAARAGDMQVHMDRELAHVPLPPSFIDDKELVKVYREAMDDKREPYRQGAIGGYRHCLEVSTKLRWFNEESRHCEKQLNELLPEEYPIAAEIMPTAEHDLWFIEVPGPILERKKGEDPNVSDIDPLEGL